MSNARNTNGQNGQAATRLSKGQRSRRNRAARAAAGGSSAPFQPTRLGPGAHSLPPKPGKPPQSQPYQAQHWRATQVIRRQQRTPSAFLKLPADILAQIILHLNPLDLIYLTQVNTSVRRVLMHRSASPMWRACIENAGLPTCPLELSEPKYVSTLYLPICSACGGKGEQRLDTYLLVRLCLPCSEQMLVSWETIKPADLQAVVFASTESYHSHKERAEKLQYSLRREVNDARAQMNQLWDSRDAKALQTWVQTRKEELQMRKERGGHIVEFLQTAHQNKLDELRREWVKEAECRLLALGYTLMKEKDLPPQKRGAWRELFHRTDPFTETKWNKLKQRVIDFLKAETNERAQRERKQRLSNRDSALCELFKSLRCEIDTLPDDPEELSAAQQVAIMVDWLPLPKYEEASKWPIMQDLLEMDVPVEEMTSQFDKRRDKFKQMMGNWGERVKQGWANALREGRKAEGLSMDPPRLRLTVGETEMDPFEGADADTNLLLRADSFFEHQDRFEICTYEELAQHFHDGSCTSWATLDSTTTHLTFSSTASAIAREFLALLKQPDASSPGLTRGWFRCGRCHTPTMDWHMSVKHYIYMARDWEKAQAHLSTFLKLGIAYNNTHDLKSVNPKDLLKQLSGQEAADVDARFKKLGKMPWIEQVAEELRPLSSNNHPTLTEGETSIGHLGTRDEGVEDGESWEEDDWDQECLTCALCRRGGLDGAMSTFATIPDMFDHLRNVHDVSDPQRGIVLGDSNSIMSSPYFRIDE